MKLSKKKKIQCVYYIKDKRFLSLLTNKIFVELEAYRKRDRPQIHSQGVERKKKKKVVFLLQKMDRTLEIMFSSNGWYRRINLIEWTIMLTLLFPSTAWFPCLTIRHYLTKLKTVLLAAKKTICQWLSHSSISIKAPSNVVQIPTNWAYLDL